MAKNRTKKVEDDPAFSANEEATEERRPTIGEFDDDAAAAEEAEAGAEAKAKSEEKPLRIMTTAEMLARKERNDQLAELMTEFAVEPVVVGVLSAGELDDAAYEEHHARIVNSAQKRLSAAYMLSDAAGLLGYLENLPVGVRLAIAVVGTGFGEVGAGIAAGHAAKKYQRTRGGAGGPPKPSASAQKPDEV